MSKITNLNDEKYKPGLRVLIQTSNGDREATIGHKGLYIGFGDLEYVHCIFSDGYVDGYEKTLVTILDQLKEVKPMGSKVICANCTFGEGLPGGTCGWCSQKIVAWSGRPTIVSESRLNLDDFVKFDVSGWRDYGGGCYCESKEDANNNFDWCKKTPAVKTRDGAINNIPTDANYLCQRHWDELTVDENKIIGQRGACGASDQYSPLRIFNHNRLGDIYVFNHGPRSIHGPVWFASLEVYWSNGSASQAEAHENPITALASLISKHDK